MAKRERKSEDPLPLSIEELRVALKDPSRREEIREKYGDQLPTELIPCDVELKDAPGQRKRAVFNSW